MLLCRYNSSCTRNPFYSCSWFVRTSSRYYFSVSHFCCWRNNNWGFKCESDGSRVSIHNPVDETTLLSVYISWHLLLTAYYSSSQCGYQNSEEPAGPWAPHHTDSLCETIGRWSYLVFIFPRLEPCMRTGQLGWLWAKRKQKVWVKGPETKQRGPCGSIIKKTEWWSTVGLGWNEQFLKEQGCTKISRRCRWFVLLPSLSCVFIACGDAAFHAEGHRQPRNNALKFQKIISRVRW